MEKRGKAIESNENVGKRLSIIMRNTSWTMLTTLAILVLLVFLYLQFYINLNTIVGKVTTGVDSDGEGSGGSGPDLGEDGGGSEGGGTYGGNPVCGNGIRESSEQCDDGNENIQDSCDTYGQAPYTNGQCKKTFCGDGEFQLINGAGLGGPNNNGYEDCDDGPDGSTTCSPLCVIGDFFDVDSDLDGISDDGALNGLTNYTYCNENINLCDDNCINIKNGPNGGRCIGGINNNAPCTSNNACSGGFCSLNQEDYDDDGQGDVCDNDIDNDGIINSIDQCPNTPASQKNNVNNLGCTNTTPPPTPPTVYQCSDNIDNDGDGDCDYNGGEAFSPGCSAAPDTGCNSPTDNTENSNPPNITNAPPNNNGTTVYEIEGSGNNGALSEGEFAQLGLRVGDQITYILDRDSQQHYIDVTIISSTNAIFVFTSTPQTIPFAEGEGKGIDVTNNGKPDIALSLDHIQNEEIAYVTLIVLEEIETGITQEALEEVIQNSIGTAKDPTNKDKEASTKYYTKAKLPSSTTIIAIIPILIIALIIIAFIIVRKIRNRK